MVAGEAAPRGPTLLRARLSHKLAQTNRWAHADTIWWLCIRFTLFNFISIKCVLMSHVSAPRLGIDPIPDIATVLCRNDTSSITKKNPIVLVCINFFIFCQFFYFLSIFLIFFQNFRFFFNFSICFSIFRFFLRFFDFFPIF